MEKEKEKELKVFPLKGFMELDRFGFTVKYMDKKEIIRAMNHNKAWYCLGNRTIYKEENKKFKKIGWLKKLE